MKRLLWIAAITAPSFAACNYTVGECYPRGQGEGNAGVGGGDVILIPSGAGGGLGAEPPEPGGASGSIACNSDEEPEPEPEFGIPANQYVNCRARGLDAAACSEACLTAGASCVPLALHPYKSGLEPGKLTSCKNGWPTTTCTYTFANTDGCSLITTFGVGLKWFCKYVGG